jgi:hypothetical protein
MLLQLANIFFPVITTIFALFAGIFWYQAGRDVLVSKTERNPPINSGDDKWIRQAGVQIIDDHPLRTDISIHRSASAIRSSSLNSKAAFCACVSAFSQAISTGLLIIYGT